MAAQGPSSVAGSEFDPLLDDSDDLPRTFRREKEARARERAAQERAAAPTLSMGSGSTGSGIGSDERPRPQIYASADFSPNASPNAATDASSPLVAAAVKKFDVPFVDLVWFFLKAVLASVPALIMLTAILWMLGAMLEFAFPWLIKMKILTSFPN